MNKKLLLVVLLAAVFLMSNLDAARAQENNTLQATYVIQVGDTLSSIATRFGIELSALIEANNISDPNNVFVGTALALPGVDWVAGELDVTPIGLGTTYKGLQRQLQLDDETLVRLMGISSPAQLAVGYPALLPVDRIVYDNVQRTTLGETSLFETSVANGINLWEMMAANDVENAWSVTNDDVLLLPGIEGTGPNGLPSPISSVDITGGNFVQGKTTVIEIETNGTLVTWKGELQGQPLNFMQDGLGGYVVLQGVHAMSVPGYYPITIAGVLENGQGFGLTQLIEVTQGDYGFETITVDPSLLEPEKDQAELAFIQGIVSPATPARLWQQIFIPPTEYGDVINSFYGTRRSYNDSFFNYFHSGVDFGGGAGVEITAPAPGEVVFAGTLEIRGNATIINHGWGVYTGYWHQKELKVAAGDTVSTGQVIGVVGNTGRSSGAHLHWEMWVGGVQVEPLDWLQFLYP